MATAPSSAALQLGIRPARAAGAARGHARVARRSAGLGCGVMVLGAAGILVLSAACGAAATALFTGVPCGELLNWTASPLVVRQLAPEGTWKVVAGHTRDLRVPARGAIHVQAERPFDGARCWATLNAGERVIVLAKDGALACVLLQGRLAEADDSELGALYRSDVDQPRG